jgi:hypothetical protein
LPPEVVSWVEAFGTLNDGPLLENARKAVAIVGEDGARSELRQLWDEADVDDATAWRQAVADLRKRLT